MRSHLFRAAWAAIAVTALALPAPADAQEPGDKTDKVKQAEQAGNADRTEKGGKAAAAIGDPAPTFVLTDTEGNEHDLAAYLEKDQVVVLEWFNPDCPFVKKHHEKTRSMAETYAMAEEAGVVWLAVNSNAPGKQGNGLERNRKAREDYGIPYPILLDESGEVGRLYGAKTTPHMFIIDKDGTLVYAGAIDNLPNPDPKKLGDVNYVRKALGECLAGKPVGTAESKPYGCSVKYAS